MTVQYPPPRPPLPEPPPLPELPDEPVQYDEMDPVAWTELEDQWRLDYAAAVEARGRAVEEWEAGEDDRVAANEAEFQELAHAAWDGMSLDEKFEWAEGHDIRTLVDGDDVYDVRTRTLRT